MASVNKVILIGNLGRDPETRYTTEGSMPITTLALATTRVYKNQAGQKVEETEWHRVILFSRLAEICQQYLRKGSSVYIEGRLRTRKWEKDGQTHYATEIVGESMQMLGGRAQTQGAPVAQPADEFETFSRTQPMRSAPMSSAPTQRTASQIAEPIDTLDEDIPF